MTSFAALKHLRSVSGQPMVSIPKRGNIFICIDAHVRMHIDSAIRIVLWLLTEKWNVVRNIRINTLLGFATAVQFELHVQEKMSLATSLRKKSSRRRSCRSRVRQRSRISWAISDRSVRAGVSLRRLDTDIFSSLLKHGPRCLLKCATVNVT